jgi:hypothetical protein
VLTLTAANVGAINDADTYADVAFAAMVVDGVYSIYYLGQHALQVTVTAVDLGAGTVTATVDA